MNVIEVSWFTNAKLLQSTQNNQHEAWWENDSCLFDYSEMEDIQNDNESPLVWSSMQDLASCGEDHHEKGGGSAQNYKGGVC